MLEWRRYRGLAALLLLTAVVTPVHAAPPKQQTLAPTYTIFATRQGLVGYRTANGHIIQPRDRFVALPSWKSLAPRGSNKYQVRLTYRDRTVVVPVWDVGPWNTNDDYWSPNRRYGDIPVGQPMAHAAYHHGYNDGRDEFGRRIRHPNGIDIADGTFWDDLGMTRNDYVQVTFLWLGNDPGPGNAIPITNNEPVATPAPQPPMEEGAIAVDNNAAGYNANQTTWYSENCGVGGNHAWTYSTPDQSQSENLAAWAPTLPKEGFYEVKAFIPACGKPATTGARYRITHDGAVTEVTVDQESSAGTWTSLGVYHFGSLDQPKVELSDTAVDSKRSVRFDAVAWLPRADTAPPDAMVLSIVRKDNGYTIQWGGDDDVSGIAAYDVQVRHLPDGGWTTWKTNTSATSAWFGPDEGKQFAFRVRGRDWAGREEAWPENADADTTCADRPEPGTNCTP